MEIGKPEIIDFNEVELPETLYKYRDFNDDYHKKLISHREVFYASPTSFEDKFDFKNHHRYDLLTDEEILNYFFEDSKKYNPNITINERMQFAIDLANSTGVKDKSLIIKWQNETFKGFDLRCGVLSLTAHPTESEMWSKYSKNSSGFCVGFEPKIILRGLGTGGSIVNYVKELPIIHPTKNSRVEQIILQIFSKLEFWSFEKEYRSYLFRFEPLTSEQRTIVLPPAAFKELIIGINMFENDIERLLKLIPNELNHIQIKKMKIVNHKIEIVNA